MSKLKVERYWEVAVVVLVVLEVELELEVVDIVVKSLGGVKVVLVVLYRIQDSSDFILSRSSIICAIVVMGAQSRGTIG